jgi:serine/threonine-protein kinase
VGRSRCLSPEELTAFNLGDLPETMLDAIAEHLEQCPRCEAAARSLDGISDPIIESIRGSATLTAAPPAAVEHMAPTVPGARTQPPGWPGATPPQLASEIRALLHARLRLMCTVGIPVFGLLLSRSLGLQGPPPLRATAGELDRILLMLLVGVNLVAAPLLWLQRDIPLGRLRSLELVLHGLVVAFCAVSHYVMLASVTADADAPAAHVRLQVEHVTLLNNLAWYFVLTFYGLFIPNTWRRSLAVIGATVLVPLCVTVAAGAVNPVVAAQLPAVLAVTTSGLLLASSLALFGSFKISSLQKEAVAARQLGPYRLQEKLGAGGMGEVYLAEHRLLKRPCAVKLIRPERASDPELLQRFEREVQATAQLTHFNTVEVFDYGRTDDGTFYYVMEYLPGLSLDAFVRRHGPVEPARAVHYLRQLCGALKEAHDLGLVHRDIKPSNVIVCTQGGRHDVVKLLDFGLVRTLGATDARRTQPNLIMGTPEFLSPEQAQSKPTLDGRSDLYSLGGLAYYLLTGHPPFAADSLVGLLMAHMNQPPRPLRDLASGVPEDLEAVVLRCLAKDPAERFADADSLEQALGQCRCAGQWTEARAKAWQVVHGETPAQKAAPSTQEITPRKSPPASGDDRRSC